MPSEIEDLAHEHQCSVPRFVSLSPTTKNRTIMRNRTSAPYTWPPVAGILAQNGGLSILFNRNAQLFYSSIV